MRKIQKAMITMLSLLLSAALLGACAEQSVPQPVPTAAEITVPVQTLPQETQVPTIAETEPVPLTYDTVPLFFQTDYPYIKFGDGTIATSGCSMTALAMVATYLTDHERRISWSTTLPNTEKPTWTGWNMPPSSWDCPLKRILTGG